MAGTCSTSIYALVIMFFAFLFTQRLELVSGTTIIGYSNVSCLESERKALLQFRQSLIDESNRLSSWTGDDCCSWHGVGCSKETGNVLKLDLHTPIEIFFISTNLLRGKINSSLQNLKHLSFLDLSMNNFSGIQSPEFFGSLKNLRYLDLSQSCFVGKVSHYLGNLSRLQYLDLSTNEFEGSIPSEMRNLGQLRKLYLSWNHFQGSIPVKVLKNLTQLTHLDLSDNMFSGSIPTAMSNLTQLTWLYLNSNSLTGNLPPSLERLTSLKELDISINLLSGVFPTSIGQLSTRHIELICLVRHIEGLTISNGSISGTIPDWFENLYSRVTYLDLSYNQIKGNWLEEMLYSRAEALYLNHNQLTGKIILFPTSNLMRLDLSYNLLSGLVVANNDSIQESRLMGISLANNGLVGGFPSCLCNMTTLFYIQLSNNQISGELPSCLGNLKNLVLLDATNNTLSGLIPNSLGYLQNLESLHLHNNKFHGKLPSSFQHLTNLVTLDLARNAFTGVIPPWIGQTLSYLRFLSLQSNNFLGAIPLQLCQLSNLQLLNLAENNISGCIPSCFGNFTSMARNPHVYTFLERFLDSVKGTELEYSQSLSLIISIDLSNNFIVGEIPKELMGLFELISLNLAGNQIKGRIPEEIGSLRQLFRLDLSRNKLSGVIPQSLSNISFLSQLNLSFNDLSGRIPTGHQLQTLNDPSIYMGNNQLCGPPSSNRCPGDQESPDHHNHGKESESEDDEDDDYLLFYSGVGPGFVVGFLGFCGALHFNKSWRYAYFHFFEKVCKALAVKTAWLRHKFCKHGTKG